MRVLLISNSTNANGAFLEHAMGSIADVFNGVNKVLFIPYAAVTFSFDEYESRVQKVFSKIGIEIDSLHRHRNPKKAVQEAEAIMVGGGNTFRLAKIIQQYDLIEAVRYKILSGTPYVGWSAGAVVACPTICTTNDMPIVEPDNFSAFNLVRFQINPHYTNECIPSHMGESRDQRIEEYLELDPFVYVVGLPERTMLMVDNGDIQLMGGAAKVFRHGSVTETIEPGDDLDFLFE